ncbi:MAG: cupredoxin domain-containing protein [Nitrospirae bacterium]|nr:cupredoxin domain-containing protein [Nitrospirota bacterium]
MKYWFLFVAFLSLAPVALRAEDEDEALHVTQRATVRLADYRFEPSTVTFKAGETAELTLINADTMLHEFVVPSFHDMTVELEINGVIAETLGIVELELAPKTTAVLRFTPEQAGTHSFSCHAKKPKDHLAAGMTGTLMIR